VCASPRLETGWLGVSAVLFGQTLAVIQDVEIPLGLTADASLNQVVIGDFGCPEVAGMRAGQACSRDALLALATECGLAGLRPDRLSDGIGAAVASASPGEAQAAAAALVSYGGRLGALIATLRHPRTPGEQGRTPIRRAFLAYWLSVDSIWLGGGLLAGRCGAVIVAAAQAAAAASAWPCRVALTPYPEIAPLLGAALHGDVTGAAEVIVVADLGHTSIKTAIAERHSDRAHVARCVRSTAVRRACGGGRGRRRRLGELRHYHGWHLARLWIPASPCTAAATPGRRPVDRRPHLTLAMRTAGLPAAQDQPSHAAAAAQCPGRARCTGRSFGPTARQFITAACACRVGVMELAAVSFSDARYV
jgi:hypothetical protein